MVVGTQQRRGHGERSARGGVFRRRAASPPRHSRWRGGDPPCIQRIGGQHARRGDAHEPGRRPFRRVHRLRHHRRCHRLRRRRRGQGDHLPRIWRDAHFWSQRVRRRRRQRGLSDGPRRRHQRGSQGCDDASAHPRGRDPHDQAPPLRRLRPHDPARHFHDPRDGARAHRPSEAHRQQPHHRERAAGPARDARRRVGREALLRARVGGAEDEVHVHGHIGRLRRRRQLRLQRRRRRRPRLRRAQPRAVLLRHRRHAAHLHASRKVPGSLCEARDRRCARVLDEPHPAHGHRRRRGRHRAHGEQRDDPARRQGQGARRLARPRRRRRGRGDDRARREHGHGRAVPHGARRRRRRRRRDDEPDARHHRRGAPRRGGHDAREHVPHRPPRAVRQAVDPARGRQGGIRLRPCRRHLRHSRLPRVDGAGTVRRVPERMARRPRVPGSLRLLLLPRHDRRRVPVRPRACDADRGHGRHRHRRAPRGACESRRGARAVAQSRLRALRQDRHAHDGQVPGRQRRVAQRRRGALARCTPRPARRRGRRRRRRGGLVAPDRHGAAAALRRAPVRR
mmetsp:Transcript_11782/g.36633  ORF Transcript_11782/g.36633 Transcript_11782/m.36633 type:complete len:565 (+) Transcript_11782:221-1915(+)